MCYEPNIMIEETMQPSKTSSVSTDFSDYLEKYGVGTLVDGQLTAELGHHISEYLPIFYKGNREALFCLPRVAVVGTRQPSELGVARTRKLVKELAALKISIVSGMAKGIDAVAHTTALDLGATTIAVLGTPVHRPYPAENKELYQRIVEQGLVISSAKPFEGTGKYLFPRRNRLMALMCSATIIVEAGATSGVVHQAAECLRQKKRLFILKSLAEDPKIEWTHRFLKSGAEVLEDLEQLAVLAK